MVGWRKAWYRDYTAVRARFLAALVYSRFSPRAGFVQLLKRATTLLRKFSKRGIDVTEKGGIF
jgi:hypothetical protein